MAHEVEFSVPPRDLGRADIEFNVKKDGVKLGTLVSRRDRSYGSPWTRPMDINSVGQSLVS